MGKQTARANLTIPGAIAMILAAAGASAQQAPPADKPVLGEIIVTAQKRAESVRDVPSAVSVVSQSQLENFHVTQLSDIAGYVPGLQVTSNGSAGQQTISLRGIAPISPGATVATYVDETPLGSSGIFQRETQFQLDLLPYDVEQWKCCAVRKVRCMARVRWADSLKYVTRPRT